MTAVAEGRKRERRAAILPWLPRREASTTLPAAMAPARITLVLASALCFGLGCDKSDGAKADENLASSSSSASAAQRSDGSASLPPPPDVAAPPKNAQKTESGLASLVLTKGTGKERPTEYDRVKVHYTGWTKDGKMFDSSVQRGEPTSFALRQVIKGWTEGVQLMTVGEKRRFWIPGNLAYGDVPARPGAPAGQLTFDIELLEIIPGPKPPPVPVDVKAPPATATKTKSGLAHQLLEKGTGTTHPGPTDRVQVHYTGWTTDGEMFDSSVVRGRPSSFSVNRVIKGWTEGLQLMVEGEKRRFWIPADLAYGDTPTRPGAPSGMLVFDVELLRVMSRPSPQPEPRGSR